MDRQPSDDALMGRIAEGDAPAFRQLLNRHLAPVTSFCFRQLGNRQDAEDAAQDTFLKVWQAAAGWKPEAKPTTWIYR
ncbi:MAG: sigma factor, partial [Pseudomonadota bacterium]